MPLSNGLEDRDDAFNERDSNAVVGLELGEVHAASRGQYGFDSVAHEHEHVANVFDVLDLDDVLAVGVSEATNAITVAGATMPTEAAISRWLGLRSERIS